MYRWITYTQIMQPDGTIERTGHKVSTASFSAVHVRTWLENQLRAQGMVDEDADNHVLKHPDTGLLVRVGIARVRADEYGDDNDRILSDFNDSPSLLPDLIAKNWQHVKA